MPLQNDVQMHETQSLHENYINCQKKFQGTADKTAIITTSDPNGYIKYWDVSKY